MRLPRTAVIGAGSSGIAAVKALLDAEVPTVCFEKGDRVGGNWVFRNSNGVSSAYRSLHINTSRERMAYRDFPMPVSYPDFPHHSHIAEYFQAYADRFRLAEHIRFSTSVSKATPRSGGGWSLLLSDGTVEDFDALVVANGHHWDPRWPDFPGASDFPGVQMHAHDFEDGSAWRDKVVVVLGMGNSAMDIAVEASWVATTTYLAARTPVHIIPKYLFGRPIDQVESPRVTRSLPWQVRQRVTERLIKITVGDLTAYGLRNPEHGLMQAHPTVSDVILSRLAHGKVVGKPNIERFDGPDVVFADGSRVRPDVVVYATGYRISFPFLDAEVISAPDNRISLYKRVFSLEHPDLAFVGLVQPLGAIMPLAEEQSRLVAARLSGAYETPALEAMRADVVRADEAVRRRYIASKRHTIQVDFESYLHELKQERRRGARRLVAAR